MNDKLTKRDREFLASIGVATNGHTAPEPAPDISPIFDAQDMERRAKKLKAEGRMPSLSDVLKFVREKGG